LGPDSPKENPVSAAAGDVRASSDLSRQASELSWVWFRLQFSCGSDHLLDCPPRARTTRLLLIRTPYLSLANFDKVGEGSRPDR